MRRPPSVLATALLLAAVVGCGGPTIAGTPVTSGSPSSQAPTAPTFDAGSSTVVIEVVAGHATEGGSQGTSRLRVYGDGRVERTAPDGIGTVRVTVDDRGVATLLAAADRLGLLSDPDLGDVMITDVGSTSLTVRLLDRTVDLEVIGPGITGVGSPSVERARANFSVFLAQLWSLDGVGITQQPRTVYPRSVLVTAFLAKASSSDVPWPLVTPARSVFANSSCAVVSGGEVQRLARMLAEQQRRRSSPGAGRVTVATGDVGVPALTLHVSTEPAPCRPAPTVRTPLPSLPWPADARERAGQWQIWQTAGALERAADGRTLGLGDPGYLRNYEFQYVSGKVAGATVIDVVATPDDAHSGRDDIPSFVARVDPTPRGGPVVSKSVRT